MADTSVGGISYELSLDTAKLIEGQRKVDQELKKTERSFNGLGDSVRDADKQLGDFAKNINPMNLAIAGLTAGIAAAGVASAKAADEVRLMGSRVEIAAGGVAAGAAAMAEIIDIARETRNGVAETAQVFTRLNQLIVQMGGNQQDTLNLTELLGKAIKTSGASAVEASAAMLQFGQALGSGKLQGDELRSLMETAPYLMRQLADGIGVPIGALKKLGEEGKLTSDVVVAALGKAAEQIGADFEKMGLSLTDSMTLATDAAGRLNEQMDQQTGLSAALTGVVKGVADAFDGLLVPVNETTKAAQKLERERSIAGWAQESTEFMAMLADAADVVWQTISVLGRNVAFVFKGIGTEIGGIGAQVAAVLQGDFGRAGQIGDMMKADAEKRRKDLDAADAKTLADRESWGDRIRRQAGKNSATVYGDFSKLTPQVQEEAKKKTGKKGKSEEQKEADKQARQELKDAQWLADEVARIRKKEESDIQAARQEDEKTVERGKKLTQDLADTQKSPALIAAEEWGARLEAIQMFEDTELRMAEENEEKKLEIKNRYNLARMNADLAYMDSIKKLNEDNSQVQLQQQQLLLSSYGSVFDNLAGMVEAFGGKQSGAYKAMFAASKAFALANAGLNLYSAISQAMADPTALTPAQKLANYATIATAAGGVVSAIAGMNYGGGRQYGGPVSSGSLYRVNETGQPEMFTASNGKQYMMPTSNGNVTPANQVGAGSGAPQINIHNYAGAEVTATSLDEGRIIEIAVRRSEANLTNQVSSGSGGFYRSLTSNTNLQGKTR